eukprot:1158486-Pelagomonas_calceolata.AAC.1
MSVKSVIVSNGAHQRNKREKKWVWHGKDDQNSIRPAGGEFSSFRESTKKKQGHNRLRNIGEEEYQYFSRGNADFPIKTLAVMEQKGAKATSGHRSWSGPFGLVLLSRCSSSEVKVVMGKKRKNYFEYVSPATDHPEIRAI